MFHARPGEVEGNYKEHPEGEELVEEECEDGQWTATFCLGE